MDDVCDDWTSRESSVGRMKIMFSVVKQTKERKSFFGLGSISDQTRCIMWIIDFHYTTRLLFQRGNKGQLISWAVVRLLIHWDLYWACCSTADIILMSELKAAGRPALQYYEDFISFLLPSHTLRSGVQDTSTFGFTLSVFNVTFVCCSCWVGYWTHLVTMSLMRWVPVQRL